MDWLLLAGGGLGISIGDNVTARDYPFGGTLNAFYATDSAEMFINQTFSASHFYARVITNTLTNAATCTTRKTGGAGSQTFSITALTTGEFEDTTNSDSLVSGDTLHARVSVVNDAGGVTAVVISVLSTVLTTAAEDVIQFAGWNGFGYGSGTGYRPIAGEIERRGTEADTQVAWNTDAVASSLHYCVSANSLDGASTITFRKNGANGNQTISILATATGDFEDSVNTDVVAEGDLINIREVAGGSSGTMNTTSLSVHLTGMLRFLARGWSSGTATHYAPLNGSQSNATEANVQGKALTALYLQNLRLRLSANTRDGISTAGLRHNGATVISVSVPASTTGVFTETDTVITVAATDEVNYINAPGGTTGSMTIQPISLAQVIVTELASGPARGNINGGFGPVNTLAGSSAIPEVIQPRFDPPKNLHEVNPVSEEIG